MGSARNVRLFTCGHPHRIHLHVLRAAVERASSPQASGNPWQRPVQRQPQASQPFAGHRGVAADPDAESLGISKKRPGATQVSYFSISNR